MSRARVTLLAALVALPVVFLLGMGSYALWERQWWFYAWWPMAACLGGAYLLAWSWQRRDRLRPAEATPPGHWTDRDRGAWAIVQARAAAVKDVPIERLRDPQAYFDAARDLGRELARHYHPTSSEPLAKVTVPEILAVVELAAHDLGLIVDQYVPGGHLVTLLDLQRADRAVDWYRKASNIYWALAAVFNPVQTGARYLASWYGLAQPFARFQQSLVDWLFVAYLSRLGHYLIELYSGRLRVGATRYRELVDRHTTPSTEGDGPPVAAAPAVTVAFFGRTKAGKSSLINALLGEQRAATNVIPETAAVTRYELRPTGVATRIDLLDSAGYGHEGPRADDQPATERAARAADVLVVVLHARDPGRAADVEMIRKLTAFFADRPDLKRPPILGVVTHIDLLSPALEWSPPYDWRNGDRPKERAIRAAVETVKEQVGGLTGVVPVCSAAGKEFGVTEELLPALLLRLDEARAVALLRALRTELSSGQAVKVLRQIANVARGVVDTVFASGPRA